MSTFLSRSLTPPPQLAYGLGTANFKSGPNKDVVDPKIIADTVTAIKAGYRHLDGADGYGNEAELGEAIRQAGVPREELYVVTKCSAVPKDPAVPISTCLDASLARLGLDYVDLYLIHSPFFADEQPDPAAALRARWLEMEAVRASGRARSIGVSNYLARHLDASLGGPAAGAATATTTVPPAINQIEFHPYLQHGDLLAYHRDKGIAVSAYAPLTAVTKARGGPLDGTYAALAKKYGVEEGDVALRWVIDQGVVAITTSGREERLRGYLNRVPSFRLTPREVEEVAEKGREKHFRGFWNHIFEASDHS